MTSVFTCEGGPLGPGGVHQPRAEDVRPGVQEAVDGGHGEARHRGHVHQGGADGMKVSRSGVARSRGHEVTRGEVPGHGAAPRHHHVHHAAGDTPGHGQRQAHAVQRVVGVLHGERL